MSNRNGKVITKRPAKCKSRPRSSDRSLRNAVKPRWDDTISDLTVHKMSSGDLARRRAGRMSKNLELARETVMNSRSARLTDISKPPPSRKYEERQEEMLREMFSSKGRLWTVLKKTDKTLAVVRNMFEENGTKSPRESGVGSGVNAGTQSLSLDLGHSTSPREPFPRFRGLPNITRAPGASAPGSCRLSKNTSRDDSAEGSKNSHDSGEVEDNEHGEEVEEGDEENEDEDYDFDEEFIKTSDNQRKREGQEEDEDSNQGRSSSARERNERVPGERPSSGCHSTREPRRSPYRRNRSSASDKSSTLTGKDESPVAPDGDAPAGKKPIRLLRFVGNTPQGDVFDALHMSEDSVRLINPALERNEREVTELRKLTDALTLELISTNQRYDNLSSEFREYKEKNEKKVSALQKMVLQLAAKLSQEMDLSYQTEIMLDLSAPVLSGSPGSDHSPDAAAVVGDEDEGDEDELVAGGARRAVCREDILVQLEELQRQRDLAQARLQAIANL